MKTPYSELDEDFNDLVEYSNKQSEVIQLREWILSNRAREAS